MQVARRYDHQADGGFKTGQIDRRKGSYPFYYLSSGAFKKIASGEIIVTGQGPANELLIEFAEGSKSATPRGVWNQVAHDAGSHGTSLLQRLIPGRKFPFPKSLYAVEDAIRFFVKNKSNAVVTQIVLAPTAAVTLFKRIVLLVPCRIFTSRVVKQPIAILHILGWIQSHPTLHLPSKLYQLLSPQPFPSIFMPPSLKESRKLSS